MERYSDEVTDSLNSVKDTRERRILNSTALLFESVRLSTFYFFKYKAELDVKKMAKKGFYYNRLNDRVDCFFCSQGIEFGSNYDEETSKHADDDDDDCAMARFPLNGNVPLIGKNDNEDTYSKLNLMLEDFMIHNVRYDIPNKKKQIIFNPAIISGKRKETFVFSTERLSTFNNFLEYLPKRVRPIKERYAEAGFVYTGFSDIVLCYECKGGLFNLHMDDDPVKDHAKFYGHCSFIREYVKKHKIDVKLQSQGELKPFREEDKKLLMFHPMVKNLLFQGYKKSDIKNLIETYVELNGCFPVDIDSFKAEM